MKKSNASFLILPLLFAIPSMASAALPSFWEAITQNQQAAVANALSESVGTETNALTFERDLRFGMRGNPNVQDLQEFLTEQGYYAGPITGNYFLLTVQAVKKFQAANGIKSSGRIFGPLTRAAANNVLASLIEDVCQEEVCPMDGVVPKPRIDVSTDSSLRAVAGEKFSATFGVSGTNGAVKFEVKNPPAGLEWSPRERTIVLSGTPSAAGVYSFSVIAREAGSDSYGVGNFTLIVKEAQKPQESKPTAEESKPKPETDGKFPVIRNVKGPVSIGTGEEGVWTINASNPGAGELSYAVYWDDESISASAFQNGLTSLSRFFKTDTFSHTYKSAGSYEPTFYAVNESGLAIRTNLSVSVKISTSVAQPVETVSPPSITLPRPLLWYTFDDATAKDSSGNGNHGKVEGGAKFSEGKSGKAMVFDGVDDFISVPTTNINLGGTQSIAFWVKMSSLSNVVNFFTQVGNYNGYTYQWNTAIFFSPNNGGLQYGSNTGGTTINQGNLNGWDTNAWHHVAFTNDGSRVLFYLDGTEVASGSPVPSVSGPISIGNQSLYPNGSGRYYLNGAMDDFRVYKDRVLTADEIRGLVGK